MNKKIAYPMIFLLVVFSVILSSCGGLGENAALSTTQTAMSLQASQSAMEIQATQTSMSIEATRAEQDRQATEHAVPTDTPVPSDTPIPPTETPTNTPEVSSTPSATATLTPTKTKAVLGPTHTTAPIQGQERVRVENNSGQDFSISLTCVGGPCQGKNPSSYQFKYPPGLWYFYVWAGRYQIKWTICGETEQFVHPLNGSWYILLKKCP